MKKNIAVQHIIDPNTLYKLPIGGIDHLQEAYAEVIDNLIKSFIGTTPSGGYILHGCVNTVAGPSNSISEGAIYFWMNFAAWNSGTAYVAKDCVSKGGYSWICIIAGTNKDPETQPTYWAKIGKHQEGQIFLVDVQVLNPLVNLVICEIRTTYATIDPVDFTDSTQKSVHAIYKIGFKDALTGTGIVDFNNLGSVNTWRKYTIPIAKISLSVNTVSSVTSAIIHYRKQGNILHFILSVSLIASGIGDQNMAINLVDIFTPKNNSPGFFIHLGVANHFTESIIKDSYINNNSTTINIYLKTTTGTSLVVHGSGFIDIEK